jgi:hypothetical protein
MTYGPRLRAVAVIFPYLAIGCSGSKEGSAKTPSSDTLPIVLEHEACDTESSSAQKVDTNGDGKPDIVRVMSDGREVCRMVDLNHDGRVDTFIYFDANGAVRRRESDFDRDGHIDEIAYYANGVPVRKDRETNLDGKLDTWDFYEGGKIHHRMRDSDGDGKVDQWWTWPNPDKVECAVIATDHNGDGKPDLNDAIDVCNPKGAPGADAGPSLAQLGPPGTPIPAAVAPDDGGAFLGASQAMTDGAITVPQPPMLSTPVAAFDAGATLSAGSTASKSLSTTRKDAK